jgi:hypothetical protein
MREKVNNMVEGKKISPVRKIVNCFLENGAVNERRAISVEQIVVDLQENEKNYILKEFIRDGYIIKMEDEKLWFNEEKWTEKIRKLTLQYSLIMGIPFIVAGIMYVILRWLS